MREFQADGWCTMKGRGQVATFAEGKMPEDLYDPDQLRGETILIDDEPYLVKAAETFFIPRSPERPYRKSFGLLVEKGEQWTGTVKDGLIDIQREQL